MYDELGEFEVVGLQQVLQGVERHPYKSKSKEFPKERLADLEVYNLLKHLEHFPTLPQIRIGDQTKVHPVAELLYKHLICLKPDAEFNKKLETLSFTDRAVIQATALQRVVNNIREQYGLLIDITSIPKKSVGQTCYFANEEGFALPAIDLSFGYHKLIPRDRLIREYSSLKECERFSTPKPLHFRIPKELEGYVTTLRVAIVGTQFPMLDSGDLYSSSLMKIACKLQRIHQIKDFTKIPKEERNLKFTPLRAGIQIVHEELEILDEQIVNPATVRLVFPGGVKIAAQLQEEHQAVTEDKKPVDLVLDFRTIADKGAVALLAMILGIEPDENIGLDELRSRLEEKPKDIVLIGDRKFSGYVGHLPVMRTHQRYTDLSKASNEITVDLISKAILEKPYKVRKEVEEEYKRLIGLRNVIVQDIARIS